MPLVVATDSSASTAPNSAEQALATTPQRQPQPGLCSALRSCFHSLIENGKDALGSDGRWSKCLKGIVIAYRGGMYLLDILDIFLDYATVAELSGMGFNGQAVWLGK